MVRPLVEYVPGNAWAVVAPAAIGVFEQGLTGEQAVGILTALRNAPDFVAASTAVSAQPLALALLGRSGDRWLLARRQDVVASSHRLGMLHQNFGTAWGEHELASGDVVVIGSIHTVQHGALPLEGGVVRAGSVQVALPEHGAPELELEFEELLAPDRDDDDPADLAVVTASVSVPAAPTVPESASVPEPSQEPEPSSMPSSASAAPGSASAPDRGTVPGLEAAATVQQAPASVPEPPSVPEPASPLAAADRAPSNTTLTDSAPATDPLFVEDTVLMEDLRRAERHFDGIIDAVPGTFREDEEPTPSAALRAKVGAHALIPGIVVPPATGPLVLSTLCEAGHVNPPGEAVCIFCHAEVLQDSSAQRSRPEFAQLVMPDGERVPLGRGVILGRRPRARRVAGGRVPRLVNVASPNEDVSRTHLELRCDDWNIVAVDLGSTNGTVMLRDGVAPQRLRPDAATILAIGDQLDLGDDVVVRIARAS